MSTSTGFPDVILWRPSSKSYTINANLSVVTSGWQLQRRLIRHVSKRGMGVINDAYSVKNIDFCVNCTVNIYKGYTEKVYSSVGFAQPRDSGYEKTAPCAGGYYYQPKKQPESIIR